jgi:hypothetical protein
VELWRRLNLAVNEFAQCHCTAAPVICLTGGRDRLFIEKLKDCLLAPRIPWPTERSAGIAPRRLLVGLWNLERIQRFAWCDEHETRIFDAVGSDDFRRHCHAIDNAEGLGLCLTCAKADNTTAECECPENVTRLSKE